MKKFGHYEVTSELGRGGMGVVYKGFEPSLNRKVAIKCLAKHLLDDDDLVERFTREAKATAALNDPNVIQIYYIGKEDGQPFFAMEYIEGQSLDDVLKGGNCLSVPHAKNILKQACMGLAAAHKIDLVHRDIKPANIMITTNGTLKIVDFGIARTREYGDKLTNTGEFVGTPGYLSPEVCIGKEVDERSDIFSLGIVFYEMLAGKVPFENDSPLGLMLEVVQSDIPDIRALNKKVDKKTSYILNKMIAKSPDERYQTCNDIIRDLGNVIDKQSIVALKKDAKVVVHQQTKSKVSEQITLPSAAAVTSNNLTVMPRSKKSNKTWLVAATLFAVVGAAAFGFYNGYLPIPNNSSNNGDSTMAFADENLMTASMGNTDNTQVTKIDPPTNTQNSAQIDETTSTEGTGLFSGVSKMFDNDEKDVAIVDHSEKIDFPQDQSETLTADTTGFANVSATGSQEAAGFQIETQPAQEQVQVGKDLTASVAADNSASQSGSKQSNNTDSSEVSMPTQSNLNTLAHNTSNTTQGIAETRTQVPPIHNESTVSVASNIVKQPVYQPPVFQQPKVIALNKGVVVIAFGDPAIANPVEKILEAELKQQGIKVMNEQFIPGMRQLMNIGLDLAELKNLIERNGGQAMVIANVNYVGTQLLQYSGRTSELINAQIDIDTYDIKTGDSIGNGFGSKINYTSLNATDQASDAVMQYTNQLAENLKDRI